VEAAASQLFEAKVIEANAGPGEGDRCGAYELVRMIGRGGMGGLPGATHRWRNWISKSLSKWCAMLLKNLGFAIAFCASGKSSHH